VENFANIIKALGSLGYLAHPWAHSMDPIRTTFLMVAFSCCTSVYGGVVVCSLNVVAMSYCCFVRCVSCLFLLYYPSQREKRRTLLKFRNADMAWRHGAWPLGTSCNYDQLMTCLILVCFGNVYNLAFVSELPLILQGFANTSEAPKRLEGPRRGPWVPPQGPRRGPWPPLGPLGP